MADCGSKRRYIFEKEVHVEVEREVYIEVTLDERASHDIVFVQHTAL